MRALILSAALLMVLVPGAAGAIPCSDLPMAEQFVQKLRPGPNTREADRHLAAAKSARTQRQCSAELRLVDTYARRSVAADRRASHAAR